MPPDSATPAEPENRTPAILVVDDDAAIRQTLSDVLTCESYDCRTASNADEALESIRNASCDLLITDFQLSEDGRTGMELIEEVARIDDTIPSILITGFASISRAVDAMKRGAVDFHPKPFDVPLLTHQVAKALQERQLRLANQRLQDEVNKKAVIERLNRELNARVVQLEQLQTIAEAFSRFGASESFFERLVGLAAQLTGAGRASLMLMDSQRRFLRIRASRGLDEALIGGVVLPLGEGVAGRVAKTGRIARSAVASAVESGPHSDQNGYKGHSWMCAPLTIGGEVFGVLNMTDKVDDSDFTEDDERVIEALIEKAGLKLENQALYEGIYANIVDTITSLITTIEAKDPYTRQHSQRVTDYAMDLAGFIGLNKDEIEMIGFAGMLHDIGKIGIRDHILVKPSALTEEEYEMIRSHPLIGERIVHPLGLAPQERSIIRHHHEAYDGTGYPDGLAGEDIPMLARIVAVADAFDAITSTRSYRSARSFDDALEAISENAGTQFDPKVAQAWVAAVREGRIGLPGALVEPDNL